MPLLTPQEICDALARPLTGEAELLRAICAASPDGSASPFFAELRAAAVRDGRAAELAQAYESVLQSPGALAREECAELALEAAWFSEEQLKDRKLASEYAVRSLDFVPDSQRALSLAEALLIEADDFATLGQLYLKAVEHAPERAVKKRLVKHALSTLSEVPEALPIVMTLANLRLELLGDGTGAPSDPPPAGAAPAPSPAAAEPPPPPAASAPAPLPPPTMPEPASVEEKSSEVAARIQTYLTMLEHATEGEERAGLLFALGTLERDERSDLPAAVEHWQRAAEASPTHLGVHEALLAGYSELGDARRLDDEVSRGLSAFGDPLREKTLVRFVDALLGRGRGKEVLPLCMPLLDRPALDDAVLDALERVAMQAEDTAALQSVLERRVTSAQGAAARAQALERLGEFFDETLGDKAAASQAWKRAAAEYQERVNEGPESQRLYERALDAEPEDTEAATHLVELYAQAGEWTHVADACAALLRGPHVESTLELLLSLEERAVRAGGAHEFAALVDEALASWGEDAIPFGRRLLGAKARAFAQAERHDEAADVYQTLLEAHADAELVRELEALISASPSAEWRFHRLRWLYAWRVERASDPLAVELEWASAEEHTFNDASAAITVLERALERDASSEQALQSLARLKLTTGDVEGGLAMLAKLRALSGAQGSVAVDLQMAGLLIDRLELPAEALPLVAAVLAKEPQHAEGRRLAERIATSGTPAAFQACELLEEASKKSDSPERQRAVLELLLQQEGDGSDKRSASRRKALRKRWFKALLDLADDAAALELSARAAEEFMAEPMLWEATEGLAVRVGDPALAVTAYERALERELSAEVAELLGQRVRAFAAEHIEDPRRAEPALMRVLTLAPGARWALDHVKFGLSAARRFEELFALYDRAIAGAADADRRALLDEAAIAARDVAADADRAIGYFTEYLKLEPEDRRVDAALERLYERKGYSERLIELLGRRASRVAAEEAAQLKERIATLHVERGETNEALATLDDLIARAPDSELAYELLERLLNQPGAPADDDGWGEPLDRTPDIARLLKTRYRAQARHADVARVLLVELARASGNEQSVALLEELAKLQLEELANPGGAFQAVADLLRLRPSSQAYRSRLGALAEQLGAQRELLALLLEVADKADDAVLRATLWSDAVALCSGPLADPARAVEIHARLLHEGHERDTQLAAARALDELLAQLGRKAERCTVLERLAELESEPSRRRSALEQAAALALDELAAPERAAVAYRAMLSDDAADLPAHDGLVRALEASGRHAELRAALVARADLLSGSEQQRADLERAARISAERLDDTEGAIALWRRVREHFGRSQSSLDALIELLTRAGHFAELAALLEAEASVTEVAAPLYAQLAELHRARTGDLGAAVAAYVQAGDFAAAAQLLGDTPALLNDDAEQSIALASSLRGGGRFADAEQLLQRQLAHYGVRHPKSRKRVHIALAELLVAMGNPAQALAELMGASKHDPSDPELLLAVARLANQLAERERAEQSYRALLLVLHGGRSDAGLTRAEVYLELSALATLKGEADEARDLEASALEAAETSDAESSGLEQTLRRLGRHDLLERSLKARFERAKGPAETSAALEELVREHAARQTLTEELRATALKTAEKLGRELTRGKKITDLEPVRRLVALYEHLGEPERALALLDVLAAKSASPAERRAYDLDIASKLLLIPARRADGITKLSKLIESEAEPPPALLEQLAAALEADGKLADALAALRRASASRKSPELLRAIVRLADALGVDPAAQADELERLLEIETGAEAVALATRLAELRRSQGDAAGRERALTRVVSLDPTQAKARDELLAAYEARADWAAVERILARACATRPKDGALAARLCAARYRVLAAAGRYDDALSELSRASELEPRRAQELVDALEAHALETGSERWIARLAEAYRARGDLAAAVPLFRRAAAHLIASAEAERDGAARVAGLWEVAQLLSDVQVTDAAFTALSKLRALEPAHPGAAELTARLLVERGESAQALALLEELVRAPERARAKSALPIYRLIAEIHLQNDDLIEARDALVHAHQLDKAEQEVLLTLGLVACDLDEIDLAASSLRQVIAARDRGDSGVLDSLALADAYFSLARIEQRKGQRTSARRMAARAVQENPRHGDAERLLRHLTAT